MGSQRLLYILVVVFLTAGIGFVGYSVYKIKTRQPLYQTKAPPPELAIVRAQDEKRLEEGPEEGENPREIAKSLRRYAEQNLPKSKNFVLKYIDSPNKIIRGAAIESIGAYPDADIALFTEALKDPDKEYRISAIRGMAKRSSPDRIRLLTEYLKRLPQKSGQGELNSEKLEVHLALIRLHKTENEKSKHRDMVLEAIQSTEVPARAHFLNTLYELLPKDESLIEQAHHELHRLGAKSTLVSSFQYLVGYDHLNLKQIVHEFPVHDDSTYQKVLIDFLVSACPDQWRHIEQSMESSEAVSERNKKHLKDAQTGIKCRIFN